jgi:sugar lactone lactonase YvrE
MTTGNLSVQQIESIPLVVSTCKPGPLHTIQQDENGDIFYSDEVNHAVVSLDRHGVLRWQKNIQGDYPEQFHYPCGIALGFITHGGNPTRCLAVADSWNRRIQFLDRQGRFLTEWRSASDVAFLKPVDVRYISPVRAGDSQCVSGYWLVLDKDNHSLWTMDCEGRALRRSGRGVSPEWVARWEASGEWPCLRKVDLTSPPDDSFFDFLYYPSRIFGRDPRALYVWEPYRQNLRLVAYGHLGPLPLGSFEDREWVAADGQCLLEWSSKMRGLKAHVCDEQLLAADCPEGVPIPSNLPMGQFWMQRDDRICKMSIMGWPAGSKCLHSPAQSLLMHAASVSLRHLTPENLSSMMEPLRRVFAGLVLLSNEILEAYSRNSSDAGERNEWRDRLSALDGDWQHAQAELYSDLNACSLGIWQLRLALSRAETDNHCTNHPHALRLWDLLVGGPYRDFVALVDRCNRLQIHLQKISSAVAEDSASLTSLGEKLHSTIEGMVDWFYRWNGSIYRAFLPAASTNEESNLDSPFVRVPMDAGRLNRERHVPHYRPASLLCELEPWECPSPDNITPSAPFHMAGHKSGDLFVSLFKANRLLRMDNLGNIRTVMGTEAFSGVTLNGPSGLAFGRDDRLWLADAFNHRLLLIDPPYKSANLLKVFEKPELDLNFPSDLKVLAGGDILLADSRQNTVLRISEDHAITRVFDPQTSSRDVVRFPKSFGVDALHPEEYFWLVDRLHHRILRFDSRCTCTAAIGSFGFTPGCLFYPDSMAMFSDGMIVVTESPRFPRLVFFTIHGKEIGGLHLDYIPGGMHVQSDMLYVGQFDGNQIHRYKRME